MTTASSAVCFNLKFYIIFEVSLPFKILEISTAMHEHFYLLGYNGFQEEHTTSIHSACCRLHSGFLLGYLLDQEDGEDIFLQNVCFLSLDNRTLHPRRQNISQPLL
jgi:hypothetical protein